MVDVAVLLLVLCAAMITVARLDSTPALIVGSVFEFAVDGISVGCGKREHSKRFRERRTTDPPSGCPVAEGGSPER